MKKKNIFSQPLTKADLESALKGLSIKEDLKRYATKEDLRIEIKFSADDILAKVDENARQYRDEILTSNDKLAKTLETIREELTIGNFQTEEKIKNHEKRISRLEKAQATV